MTKPKPKPVGAEITVPEGAQVTRPGSLETITVTGGTYVLDLPGVHVIDGTEHEAALAEPEPKA